MRPLSELVPPWVRAFEAYIPSPPDAELCVRYGVQRLHRLNNNENALGPSQAAREALSRFEPGRASIYPNGDVRSLRLALAKRFGGDPDEHLIGNGSCEVIAAVVKAFCGPGDKIVTADKTFAVYEWTASFSGVEVALTPLKDFGFDPDALLAAMDERTKIVFVCNPNNPTGTWWDKATLSRFLAGVDGRAVVVLDEAYREFVDDPEFPDGFDVVKEHPNVLVFRTFSKMYGLAGLRVGRLFGRRELVDVVRKTHIVYSVNAPGQAAAEASLTDDASHIRATMRLCDAARSSVLDLCDRLGLRTVAGAGNFVMVKVPLSDTFLHRLLMKQGVMVRTMTAFRFPNWIRVTLAGAEAMSDFGTALVKALDSQARPQ